MGEQATPRLSVELVRRFPSVVNERFRRREERSSYRFSHNLHQFNNILEAGIAVDSLFDNLLQEATAVASPNDYVSCYLDSARLSTPIWLAPCLVSHMKGQDFLNAIFKVSQSSSGPESFLFDEELHVTFTITRSLRGGGPVKAPYTSRERSIVKKAVITITGKDNNCLPRAFMVAIFIAQHGKQHKDYKYVTRASRNYQLRKAKEFANLCKIPFNVPLSGEHIDLVERKIGHIFRIVVFNAHRHNIEYANVKLETQKHTIFLEYIDGKEIGHYNVIVNVRAYLGYRKFCHFCLKGYNALHSCSMTCKSCGQQPACEDTHSVICADCNRSFLNEVCYSNHLVNNLCKRYKNCTICNRNYHGYYIHSCQSFKCKNCFATYDEQPHYCYFKKLKKSELAEQDALKKVFIVYDLETTQSVKSGDLYIHTPNLVMFRMCCSECWDNNSGTVKSCQICIEKGYYFGKDCVKFFTDFVFGDFARKVAKLNGKILLIAHYSKGFDGHFILRSLWDNQYLGTSVICTGNKIMKISVANVDVIDSQSLFLLPLAKLPSAFGFTGFNKGIFPHKFNRPENYDYVGPLPDIEFFEPEFKTPKDKAELLKWHKDNSEMVFNFKDKLLEYCDLDVIILQKAVMRFRIIFIKYTGLDCFTRNFTIASIALEVFRTNCISNYELAITPINTYYNNRKSSIESSIWLDLIEQSNHISIIREYHIGRYFCDGFCKLTNTIYSFLGCYFHGHKCKPKYYKPHLYKQTRERIMFFEGMGYHVIYIWECSWTRKKQGFGDYLTLKACYKNLKRYGALKLSDSFFGGRTGNLKFVESADENEKIHYVDFSGLYPYVLKKYPYPIGHPCIINNSFDYSLETYFGFCKCIVLPPHDLYIAVLPVKVGERLIFPLCATCSETLNQAECNHNDEERKLIGTWTTVELRMAISKGYNILTIIQVLDYAVPEHNIFKDYINLWLKLKQEASGWPSMCTTTEERKAFLDAFHDKEGVRLDPEKIISNPGLRLIAKLLLNSLWGKLSQRSNLKNTELLHNVEDYMAILEDPGKEIMAESLVSDKCLLVAWTFTDPTEARKSNNNIAVASFVTAYGRLELYRLMSKIEEIRPRSLLYHDTDSAIYKHKLTDEKVELGSFLGDLTDELGGKKCIKFCSLGCKSYSLQLIDQFDQNSTEIKIKGLKLHSKALERITMNELTDMAMKYSSGNGYSCSVPQMEIRSNAHHMVYSRYFNKTLNATGNKRAIRGNSTVPYGFKE